MQHEMYDERIRAHQPQMYAWKRITTNDVTFVVFGNNLLGYRNLFNHILRYNTIHYHMDSIAN